MVVSVEKLILGWRRQWKGYSSIASAVSGWTGDRLEWETCHRLDEGGGDG